MLKRMDIGEIKRDVTAQGQGLWPNEANSDQRQNTEGWRSREYTQMRKGN